MLPELVGSVPNAQLYTHTVNKLGGRARRCTRTSKGDVDESLEDINTPRERNPISQTRGERGRLPTMPKVEENNPKVYT